MSLNQQNTELTGPIGWTDMPVEHKVAIAAITSQMAQKGSQ